MRTIRTLTAASVAAFLFQGADAACPNACSGHGSCQPNDRCACFANWDGADCSLRVCEFGPSWAKDDVEPHSFEECSGQGVCNRASGVCECTDGFTGRACSRSKCPNKCSGHGLCKNLADLDTEVAYSADNWDAERIQACECDAGYFGADCSQKRCPTGDDPMTSCTNGRFNQVQEVRFKLGSKTRHDASDLDYTTASEEMDIFGTANTDDFASLRSSYDFGQLRLTYVDSHGASWVAHGIDGLFDSDNTVARDSAEIALETLPANKVRDVAVTTTMTTLANGGLDSILERKFLITFLHDATNSNNIGLQNTLKCDSGFSCNKAGCQPIVKMPFLYRYGATDVPAAVDGTQFSLGAANVGDENIYFYTGEANTDSDFDDGKFIRLSSDSQPQMPVGVDIDDKVDDTTLLYKRYDLRIVVAVIDPADGSNNENDIFYTRVVFGHNNIISLNERIGSDETGVWGLDETNSNAAKTFKGTLDGFDFNGPIPRNSDGSASNKVPVPGAPGVFLDFPSLDMIDGNAADGEGKWFEILVKLPVCNVNPVIQDGDAKEVDGSTNIFAIDSNVENIECSGRGKCNRGSGECKCFEGYFGIACNQVQALV